MLYRGCSLTRNVLWRDVARRSAEGVCPPPLVQHLGKAEVAQASIALDIHQHVLGLEIAVHDAVLVQVFKGEDYAAGVEARCVLLQTLKGPGSMYVRKRIDFSPTWEWFTLTRA